jgi:hypothetical protein
MYLGDIEQLARDRQAALLAEAERRRLLRLAGAVRTVRADPAARWPARAVGLVRAVGAVARLALAPGARILVFLRRPRWAAPAGGRSEAPGQPGQQPA